MDDDNKRIDIDDLPKAAEELSDDEQKGVTGGKGTSIPTGTVTFTVDGTSSATKENTIGGSLADSPSDPSRKMGDGSV